MSSHVDIKVTIDGEPVPLPAPIAGMVSTIVENREDIRRLGAGEVTLSYNYQSRATVIRLLQVYRKGTRNDPLS